MFQPHTTRFVLSALILLFMLTACGSGDDDSMGVTPDIEMERPAHDPTPEPEPELVHPPQKPGTLPDLPLLRLPDASQTPIIHRGESTHVGASLGSGTATRVATHGNIAVSYNGMLGGLSTSSLIGYLAADAAPDGQIKRWATPPTIYVDDDATAQMISDTVFAIQIINSFLPDDWQLQFGSGNAPSLRSITVHFKDEGLSDDDAGGRAVVTYDAPHQISAATVYLRPDHWMDAGSFRDPQHRIYLLAHEIFHGLGRIHVPFDRTRVSGLTIMDPSARGSSGFVLFPVDQEALHAIHSELEPGDSLDVVAEKLGNWDDMGVLLRGDFDIPEGDGSFGVSMRHGLASPWASGPTPWALPADNPVLSGTAAWEGRLLGFTPEAQPVAGSAQLGIDLSALSGDLDFQSLEWWAAGLPPGAVGTGQQWGDGDLSYDIQVRDNTFIQTGGDAGTVTGAFFGPQHEGMGGVLERDDLTAAFGGKR